MANNEKPGAFYENGRGTDAIAQHVEEATIHSEKPEDSERDNKTEETNSETSIEETEGRDTEISLETEADSSEIDFKKTLQELASQFSDLKSIDDFDSYYLRMFSVAQMHFMYINQLATLTDALISAGFPSILKRILEMTSKARIDQTNDLLFLNEVLNILRNFTAESVTFSKAVLDQGIVKFLVADLRCEEDTDNRDRKENFLASLGALENLTQHCPHDKSYEEAGLKECAKTYLRSQNEGLRLNAIMILSRILTQDEIANIDDAGTISHLVTLLKSCNNNPDPDGEERKFARVESESLTCFRLYQHEIIDCIVRIAVGDVNKKKLIAAGILPCHVEMMESTDAKQQLPATNLTWILCSDPEVRQKVIEEEGCIEALEKLYHSDESEPKVREKACQALLKINAKNQDKQ